MTSQFEELFGASPFMHEEHVEDYEEYLDSLLAVFEDKTENQSPPLVSEECCAPSSSGRIKLIEEKLDLQCEWRGCNYRICSLHEFVSHVSLHIPHLEVRQTEGQEGTGSVVFSHVLVHINFCSLLKYCRSI
jgi:hypothetical protein